MKNKKINNRAFIGIGISLMSAGVAFMLAVNTVLGLSLLAVGLGNLVIGLSVGKRKE